MSNYLLKHYFIVAEFQKPDSHWERQYPAVFLAFHLGPYEHLNELRSLVPQDLFMYLLM